MKKIYTIFVCICLLAGFVACEKDKDFVLTTLMVQNETITPSYGSATIDCSFKADATISEAFVQYSLSSSFAKYDVAKMTEEKGKYAAQLTGLQDNATYYIRYAVSNKYSSVVSEEVIEFQTLQCTVPTIVLDSIVDVWDNRAKAYLHLAFDGGASVTDMGICWSKQANPTIEDIHKSTKDTVTVLDMTDLQENTQYYVRAYAVNKVGVAYSEEKEFTTYALPEVRTEDVSDIQVNSAFLSATLVFDGNDTATIKGFCWSDKSEPTIEGDHIAIDTASAGYTYLLTALLSETQYFVRAYAQNKIGIVYGEEVSFTTNKSVVLPSVTTTAITKITETSAVAGGNVTSDGNASVTERGVCIATVSNPTTSNTKITAGSGTGSFTCNLTGLQANTTYYVRAYAVNSKGTAYGEQVSFTTNKTVVLPSVTTSTVTQITQTTAVAGGNVTADGNASVTERGVCIATVSNPTTSNTKITAGSGTGSFTCNLTGLQANTTYYVRAYAVNSKGTAYGSQVSFTTKEQSSTPNNGTENGYAYVDLGLSVKWATCNVGANNPEDYGDYFAWGEVEPKDYYDWSTYKYCNGSYSTLTKYNKSSSCGTVDNKTQLELSDDAARANWGGTWRMPTGAEWTELREQCTWTWTIQNGVNGYRVISKTNGNSIFLPAAGYRYGSSLGSAGSYGRYWSSSLNTDYPYDAWGVYFDSSSVYREYCFRYFGHSVRPVLGESVVETTIPTVTTTIPTQITETTAVAGGNVTSDGGASVTERGVVYATTQNPTTADNKVAGGSGVGTFTCNLTGLQPNTTYYVRAYAENSKGTAYGEEVTFTTKEKVNTDNPETPDIPEGVISCAEALAICKATGATSTTETYTIRGYVTEINEAYNSTYGNISYWMADEKGGGQVLQAYRVKPVKDRDVNVKVNDYVEVVGTLVNYMGNNPMVFAGGTYTIITAGSGEIPETPNNGTENGYAYVDLGLSVKWATMNVGASKAEDYGDYFAWGEIEPKEVYDGSTYKWWNSSSKIYTKYNTSSSYGTVDNKTTLELSDDAAYKSWGGAWRMPTDAEWTELRKQCTWTWTTQNGVNGYKVTSKKSGYTSNSIFLPAAGYRYISSLNDAGSYGLYWSSSLYNTPNIAWRVYFNSNNVYGDHSGRSNGHSVRPVCP